MGLLPSVVVWLRVHARGGTTEGPLCRFHPVGNYSLQLLKSQSLVYNNLKKSAGCWHLTGLLSPFHTAHPSYKRQGVLYKHDDRIVCGHASSKFEAGMLHSMYAWNMSARSVCMTNFTGPSYEEGARHTQRLQIVL